ncbi:MAG TPA: hypothetical protein VHZ78_08470 [Rhizomicrobium sp.]|jgi:hypothetical protein|nr:hypothetical protein [Rhizomicrobium sp.]
MKAPFTRYAEALLGPPPPAAVPRAFEAPAGHGCMSFTQPPNVHLILYPEDIARVAAMNRAIAARDALADIEDRYGPRILPSTKARRQ